MAQLYADENVPEGLNELLRDLGHDVMSVTQQGKAGASDPQVLADAAAVGRAVLTFNRWDFDRLHRLSSAHAGIVSCTKDDDLVALAGRIDQAVKTEQPLASKHVRVNRPP